MRDPCRRVTVGVMATFAEWLAGIGLQQYEALFTAHDVDLGVAPDITESDLVALGLSLGHRRRFLAAAAALKRKGADAEAGASHISPAPASNAPLERRPVTVVFLDLVGSTALANRLDPEDMKALLERYREAAGGAVGATRGTSRSTSVTACCATSAIRRRRKMPRSAPCVPRSRPCGPSPSLSLIHI